MSFNKLEQDLKNAQHNLSSTGRSMGSTAISRQYQHYYQLMYNNYVDALQHHGIAQKDFNYLKKKVFIDNVCDGKTLKKQLEDYVAYAKKHLEANKNNPENWNDKKSQVFRNDLRNLTPVLRRGIYPHLEYKYQVDKDKYNTRIIPAHALPVALSDVINLINRGAKYTVEVQKMASARYANIPTIGTHSKKSHNNKQQENIIYTRQNLVQKQRGNHAYQEEYGSNYQRPQSEADTPAKHHGLFHKVVKYFSKPYSSNKSANAHTRLNKNYNQNQNHNIGNNGMGNGLNNGVASNTDPSQSHRMAYLQASRAKSASMNNAFNNQRSRRASLVNKERRQARPQVTASQGTMRPQNVGQAQPLHTNPNPVTQPQQQATKTVQPTQQNGTATNGMTTADENVAGNGSHTTINTASQQPSKNQGTNVNIDYQSRGSQNRTASSNFNNTHRGAGNTEEANDNNKKATVSQADSSKDKIKARINSINSQRIKSAKSNSVSMAKSLKAQKVQTSQTQSKPSKLNNSATNIKISSENNSNVNKIHKSSTSNHQLNSTDIDITSENTQGVSNDTMSSDNNLKIRLKEHANEIKSLEENTNSDDSLTSNNIDITNNKSVASNLVSEPSSSYINFSSTSEPISTVSSKSSVKGNDYLNAIIQNAKRFGSLSSSNQTEAENVITRHRLQIDSLKNQIQSVASSASGHISLLKSENNNSIKNLQMSASVKLRNTTKSLSESTMNSATMAIQKTKNSGTRALVSLSQSASASATSNIAKILTNAHTMAIKSAKDVKTQMAYQNNVAKSSQAQLYSNSASKQIASMQVSAKNATQSLLSKSTTSYLNTLQKKQNQYNSLAQSNHSLRNSIQKYQNRLKKINSIIGK